MRIEAVTVCLHYDDFLEQTIRVNQSLFDDWVVVTSQEDAGTVAVCQRYGVRTAFCPYFKRGGDFAKALAINIGLAHLKIEDWVVHLDADTALPRNARKHLANVELDPSCIYGIDRVECPSLEAWHS
ncbi:MAG: glycosyltransferase family A protein, partial [Isosphaeraceae bacterium]